MGLLPTGWPVASSGQLATEQTRFYGPGTGLGLGMVWLLLWQPNAQVWLSGVGNLGGQRYRKDNGVEKWSYAKTRLVYCSQK